jgi:hypothetical protein
MLLLEGKGLRSPGFRTSVPTIENILGKMKAFPQARLSNPAGFFKPLLTSGTLEHK